VDKRLKSRAKMEQWRERVSVEAAELYKTHHENNIGNG